jgi:CDP-diglyceride synthetase
MSRLAARVLTGTTVALVALLLLWLDGRFPGGWVALAVVTVLALLCAWELERMGSLGGRKLGLHLYPAAVASSLLIAGDLATELHLEPVEGLAGLYLLAGLAAWPFALVGRSLAVVNDPQGERRPRAREAIPLSLWLFPPLFALVLIDRDLGVEGLAVLIVLAKVGDNAGYFVGRAIGKRHPFPTVSPGKTVAGCVASLAAGIATGAVLLPLTLGERTWPHAALGALLGGAINVAAQASDLSESWVKRKAGVKDSSALLGPSGGVLDVIDSLFFATPVALLLWAWVYGVPGR